VCSDASTISFVSRRFYRRGRTVEVKIPHFTCARSCKIEGKRWAVACYDEAKNMEYVQAEWLKKYDEPLPEVGKKKPKGRRTVRVTVILSEAEVREMDFARGKLSRSKWVRKRAVEDSVPGDGWMEVQKGAR
jgi:hypothetical protein